MPEDTPEVPLAALLQRWHRRAPTAQVCERAEREWRCKCRGDGDAVISPAGQYSGGQALPRVPATPGPAARALPGAGLWACAFTKRLGHKQAVSQWQIKSHSRRVVSRDSSSLQHKSQRRYRAMFCGSDGSTGPGPGTCSTLLEPFLCLIKPPDPTKFLGSFCLARMQGTDDEKISAILPL